MARQRSSTVTGQARAAARQRLIAQREARREREQRIGELAEKHAVAMAVAEEIKRRAAEEIASTLREADEAVAALLEMGERAEDVAGLLDLRPAEVRAARRRARGGAAGAEDEGETAVADEVAAGADVLGSVDGEAAAAKGVTSAGGANVGPTRAEAAA